MPSRSFVRWEEHDERFDATETDRVRCQADLLQKTTRRSIAALQLEAQHPAEARHLARRELVLRMALQSRIMHRLHGRLCLQKPRQRQRVVVLLANAKRQRAHTAQQQPGIERREHAAEDDARVPGLLDE